MPAAHDFLRWIGLDRDGHRSDWNHWLYREVCKGIEAYTRRANLRGDCTLRCLCVLRFVILPGERVETPVANVLVYRVITRLCVGKSKIADELASCARRKARASSSGMHPSAERCAEGTCSPPCVLPVSASGLSFSLCLTSTCVLCRLLPHCPTRSLAEWIEHQHFLCRAPHRRPCGCRLRCHPPTLLSRRWSRRESQESPALPPLRALLGTA